MRIDIMAFIKNYSDKAILFAPLFSFAIPLLWMFLLNPNSFDAMWKGRAFQLFFVWLISLELVLSWERLQGVSVKNLSMRRLIVFLVTLLLPTIYVISSSYLGLGAVIVESSKEIGIYWYNDMPVAIEYIVFAGFFSTAVVPIMGLKGLKTFLIPILFALIVGAVFVIDSVYPNEQFTPFQFLVPATTTLAAIVLSSIGYNTSLDSTHGNLPQLTVTDPNNALKTATFGIAWPCAGIESLLIFAVTIVLFLKRMPISWQAKLIYFAFGASVTYLINILRIVSIFVFVLGGGDLELFHRSYGPLFPIAWIVSYPLIILGVQSLWRRIKVGNGKEPRVDFQEQTFKRD